MLEKQNESFFSEEQKENFGIAVVLLFMGFILVGFNTLLKQGQNADALNHVLLAFDIAGWGLIYFSVGFAVWKFRTGLVPALYDKQTDTMVKENVK